MSLRHRSGLVRQKGMVLISSLLLLLVVTILALAMFRTMGLAEKISGNVREKQRALHAAMVAEQYGEYWLSSPGNVQPPVVCSATANANLGMNNVLICQGALDNPTTSPWTSAGQPVGFTYYPNTGAQATTMSFVADASGSFSNTYLQAPSFYIQYLGPGLDGAGTVYKIDAIGYGGSPLAVAVIESTYEIGAQERDPTQK